MDDLVPKGFQVKSHEVTLHGVCASCAGASTSDKGRAGKAH
jgi:Fur family ferric uptake transcriptional regulator